MPNFRLQIITQEKIVFDRDVASLVAPGGLGYLGVLAHHAPLLTTLVKGRLQVRERLGRDFEFEIAGGFLEVSSNTATVLADNLSVISAPPGEASEDEAEE